MMTRRTSTTSTMGVTLMPTMAPCPPPDFPSVPAMMLLLMLWSVHLADTNLAGLGAAILVVVTVSGHHVGALIGVLAESAELRGELLLRLEEGEELLGDDGDVRLD